MKGGFVAVVGRPNIGKSTLVNAMAGAKASIVSRRRQTTRGIVRALCTCGGARMALLDSPGWQSGRGGDFARKINDGARWAAESADAIIFITTARWTKEDADFLSRLPQNASVVAAVNKIDLVKNKRDLLPVADALRQKYDFAALVPLSAKNGTGIPKLAEEVAALLPDSGAAALEGIGEDRDFLCAELLREKLFRMLDGELPYRVGVLCHTEDNEKNGAKKVLRIRADIVAERNSQKAIILGRGGAMLQKIASSARREMRQLCGRDIFLQTRVLVRPKWRQDRRMLSQMRIGAPDDS